MRYDLKAKLEERKKLHDEAVKLQQRAKDENRALTAEELAQDDRLFQDQIKLRDEVETAQRELRLAELDHSVHENTRVEFSNQRPPNPYSVTNEDTQLALRAVMLRNHPQQRREFIEAAEKCGVNLNSGEIKVRMTSVPTPWWEKRGVGLLDGAQGTGWPHQGSVGNTGGFLVEQSQLANRIDLYLKLYSGMREASSVYRTEIGSTLWFDTIDDTGNTAESGHTENVAYQETDVTIAHVQAEAVTYDSGVAPISIEVLQDSKFPIIPLVGRLLGIRLARKQNTDFTTANSSSILGIKPAVAASGQVFTSAGAGTFTYADIVNALYKVNAAYRRLPSFGIMMSDNFLAHCWGLVDSNNRPLMEMSAADTDFLADRLMRVPVIINNDLDTFAGGNTAVAISGAWEFSVIREQLEMQIFVFQEYYMPTLSKGIVAYERAGYACTIPAAFCNWGVHA